MEREKDPPVAALLRAMPSELRPEWDGEVVRIAREGESWDFLPVWVGEGLPADARRALEEIDHHAGTQSSIVPVVVARRVSPGAREILESQQISWADASGRAHVVVPGRIYITRIEPIRADAGRNFKWSASADAIAETLLTSRVRVRGSAPVTLDRVTVIADATDVSVAHAARVLRHFDEQGYTAKTGAERGRSATREFREPGRMLSDWAGHYAAGSGSRKPIEFHVPWRETERSLSLLDGVFARQAWALTGEVAADRIAPYLTSVPSVDFYVLDKEQSAVRERLLQHPEVTEVGSGGRIRMHLAESYVLRLADEVDGLRIASPVRVYADLLRGRGRSAEAGEHLREVAIGF